jgi:N-acetylglutamate synthase-like GNAT family acetyltransferase
VQSAQSLEWTIRRASAGDSSAIRALHKALNRPSRTDSDTAEYFVASATAESLIGCAAVRKMNDIGYLYGLVVDKIWRRRGIGHALTQERLDWLRGEAVTSVYVLAMFWNVRFFKKHGFEVTDRTVRQHLIYLHGDFSQTWSMRSALLQHKFQ